MEFQASVGFFGKLPCNGDFLQRRMPQSFLEAWDPWLQQCVHASRQALQESWLNSYLTSPVWRFVLPDAACGAGAFAGVLAPSVDRVGRYFPLTLVTQIDIDACPLDFAIQHGSWFDALEALVIAALEQTDVNVEWFDDQVLDLARQIVQAGSPRGDFKDMFEVSAFPRQNDSWRVPLRAASGLQSAVNAFAYRELAVQLRPASVWWSEGSGSSAPSWLALRGLPAPERFAAMLNGQWAKNGWSDLGDLSHVPLAATTDLLANPPNEPQPQLEQRAAPRTTVPDVQLSAIETNKAAFVIRPDVGLWAVVSTAANDDPTGVRSIADALQQVTAATSLTSLVESVRRTLTEVHRGLLHLATRDVLRIDASANVVVLLASGVEGAFLSAGKVQKFRIRARSLEAVDENAIGADAGPVDSGSLMDLLSNNEDFAQGVGSSNFQDFRVHYERLQREDQWILCARSAIGEKESAQLDAVAAGAGPISAAGIIEMLGPRESPGDVVPVMTLEV